MAGDPNITAIFVNPVTLNPLMPGGRGRADDFAPRRRWGFSDYDFCSGAHDSAFPHHYSLMITSGHQQACNKA
jgi:hypothetical protein